MNLLRFVEHCVFISRILRYSHDLTYICLQSGHSLSQQGCRARSSPAWSGWTGSRSSWVWRRPWLRINSRSRVAIIGHHEDREWPLFPKSFDTELASSQTYFSLQSLNDKFICIWILTTGRTLAFSAKHIPSKSIYIYKKHYV